MINILQNYLANEFMHPVDRTEPSSSPSQPKQNRILGTLEEEVRAAVMVAGRCWFDRPTTLGEVLLAPVAPNSEFVFECLLQF